MLEMTLINRIMKTVLIFLLIILLEKIQPGKKTETAGNKSWDALINWKRNK